MPRVITGSLTNQNRGAVEWGSYDYVAYGCQTFVVVVHASSATHVQTLEGHKFSVTKVRWPRENYPQDDRTASSADSSASSRQLRLATADSTGQILVWDVFAGAKLAAMAEESAKSVSEMFWLPWRDASNDLLLALHASPSILVLWNAEQSTRIWKKSYADSPLYSFCLDPFQYSNAAFITQNGILMLADDLSFAKPPAAQCARQFSVSATSAANLFADDYAKKTATPSNSIASTFVKTPLIKVLAASGKLLEGVSPEGTSPIGSPSSGFSPNTTSAAFDDSFLQLVYHPAVRNLLFLAYTRAVIILNSTDAQLITQIVFDRSASPLQQILPATMRDAIYFVQENGAISLRLQKYKQFSNSAVPDPQLGLDSATVESVYELLCTSESLRITKTNRVMGGTLCPTTQRRCVLLLSTGKLIFYDCSPSELSNKNNSKLLDAVPNKSNFVGTIPKSYLILSDLIKVTSELDQYVVSKLYMANTANLDFLGNGVTVMRVCPKPTGPGKHLVAVGTSDGSIQTVDIQSGEIERDLSVHSCPIKCMEWVGPYRLVTSAYTQPLSSSNLIRNELYLTDVRTGFSKILRKIDDSEDESPIELLRVSHFGCFLAVGFRDQPLEIWDLRAFRLLRRMARSCPIIVDIAWSSKHHNQSQVASTLNNNVEQDNKTGTITTNNNNNNKESSVSGHTIYRENLVILDNENHLYHVVVKGVHVRDGKEVNTQWLTSTVVTTMAWKGEILAFGYADGRISVWNLETKQSKASASVLSQRGAVKRICFSKQSSDYTFLALHTDGVSIWNALSFTCMSQLQAPSREKPFRILDADLAGDENLPVLLTADGCLRVYDHSLTKLDQSVDNTINLLCFPLLPKIISTLIKILLLDHKVLECYRSSADADSSATLTDSSTATILSIKDALIDFIRQNLDIKENDKSLLCRYFSNLSESTLMDIVPREFFALKKNSQLHDDSQGSERNDHQCQSSATRAAVIDRLLGNEWGANYWSLVEGLLRNRCPDATPLNFDMFWDNKSFYKLQVKRISTFNPKRCTPDQLKSYVENLILLGDFEQAARVLLDSEQARSDYYANCLKACVLSGAAAHWSPPGQSTTVKMAATNLIADGKLNEGVELLKIGGKNLDACRYLQSFGRWEQSAWLAKVSFKDSDDEWQEILRKWADALCSPQISKKTMATLLLLSVRQWEKFLELLLSLKQARLAVLTGRCFAIGRRSIDVDVINMTSTTDQSEHTTDAAATDQSHPSPTPALTKILQNANAQYARLLFEVGLKKAALVYAEQAGDMAANLAEEFKLLSAD